MNKPSTGKSVLAFAQQDTGAIVGTVFDPGGPGQVNLDLSLFKSFFFNRDTSGHFRPNELQFRVEAFNITNFPQFQNPNRIKGTPQFGSITELVNTSRQIQFALKFFF